MTGDQLSEWVGQKVLVNCDQWLYGPDGRQYHAVFGTLKSVDTAEGQLGIRPNGRSTNWYLRVGGTIIAGCQVHYVIKTDTCHLGDAVDWTLDGSTGKEYTRPSAILDADKR